MGEAAQCWRASTCSGPSEGSNQAIDQIANIVERGRILASSGYGEYHRRRANAHQYGIASTDWGYPVADARRGFGWAVLLRCPAAYGRLFAEPGRLSRPVCVCRICSRLSWAARALR